jgi:AcrR family transcriptional regulator
MAIESWKRLTAEERRTQLLELGLQLFNSRDYSEISVDDIAREAGISKGLLYHYFPSKEEFFRAGVEHGADQLLAACEPDPELPELERTVRALRGYLDYVEDNSFGYRNIFRGETAMLPGIQRVCDATREAIAQRFMDALGLDAAAMPATRAAFRAFQGHVEALVIHWLEQDDLERRQVELLSLVAMMTSVVTGLQMDLGTDATALSDLGARTGEFLAFLRREYGFNALLPAPS